eukprot:gnl/TRDRNA2_/TRDRNA2_160833_c0_seq1.p1 gnl/TRDRNA2_/TRDRNA2_160833_c0~~gnl/TRDRNA2_/TRDRNA2_160833_c0_seq1.p1  ORF type:complete len:309 (+),score=29.09 gnl/TRDRNA2_/TRDRNA2_160833_c0_seq1:80-1006(+)
MSSPTLAVKAFHWTAATITVPFAVGSLFLGSNDGLVLPAHAAVSLPRFILRFTSTYSHLTMVSHGSISFHFVLSLLRDHGIFPWRKSSVNMVANEKEGHAFVSKCSELWYAWTTTVGLAVAFLFWGICVVDTRLMVPLDVFPPGTPVRKARTAVWRMLFAPKSRQQRMFFWFMHYIHTLCPLLPLAEGSLVKHEPCCIREEAATIGACSLSYLIWNLFCWWLFRRPPYPVQRAAWKAGGKGVLMLYGGINLPLMFGLLSLSRAARTGDEKRRSRLIAGCIAAVCWVSIGLPPLRGVVARRQGVPLPLS